MPGPEQDRWCEISNHQFITLSQSRLDLPGLGWHVTRATISNFKSFHGSYPQYYGGSARHSPGNIKWNMPGQTLQSLLLLSTGIIQIRRSCNNQDTLRVRGNNILGSSPSQIELDQLVWQYRNSNDSHSLLYSIENAGHQLETTGQLLNLSHRPVASLSVDGSKEDQSNGQNVWPARANC